MKPTQGVQTANIMPVQIVSKRQTHCAVGIQSYFEVCTKHVEQACTQKVTMFQQPATFSF